MHGSYQFNMHGTHNLSVQRTMVCFAEQKNNSNEAFFVTLFGRTHIEKKHILGLIRSLKLTQTEKKAIQSRKYNEI